MPKKKSIEDNIADLCGADKEQNPLFIFLGKDNVDEIRTTLKDAIINQIQEDLSDSQEFTIPTDLAADMMEEIISEELVNIKPEIRKMVRRQLEKQFK